MSIPSSGATMDQNTGGNSGKKTQFSKFRLSGAARKRFKWLMENGYGREKAAALAQQPLTGELADKYTAAMQKAVDKETESLTGEVKARYSALMDSGTYTQKEALILARKTADTVPKRNASEIAGGGSKHKSSKLTDETPEMMAVTCADYPTSTLTEDQANQLKSAILHQITQQKDAEVKPHFEHCAFSKGYLKVQCTDQMTRDWLDQCVPKLELWEGASLKVIAEKQLFKEGNIFVGHFGESETDTNEEILNFIQSQNFHLDASKWKIVSRREIKQKRTTELVLTVDPESAKSIQGMRYELSYKFETVRLHNPGRERSRNMYRYHGRHSGGNQMRYGNQNRGGGGYYGAPSFGPPGNPFNLVNGLLDQLNIIGGGRGSRNFSGRGGGYKYTNSRSRHF